MFNEATADVVSQAGLGRSRAGAAFASKGLAFPENHADDARLIYPRLSRGRHTKADVGEFSINPSEINWIPETACFWS